MLSAKILWSTLHEQVNEVENKTAAFLTISLLWHLKLNKKNSTFLLFWMKIQVKNNRIEVEINQEHVLMITLGTKRGI